MANVIEETENTLILLLVFGVIGGVLWLWWKYEKPSPSPSSDGDSSWERFKNLLFGSGANDNQEYTPAQAQSMTQLAQTYVTPTASQVDEAVQNFASFTAQNPIGTDLGKWAIQNKLF